MKTLLKLVLVLSSMISPFFWANADEPAFRTIPIIEVDGAIMPGWEKQVMELYQDEEGNPVPVVFRGAAKNWQAASLTPEYFRENFGEENIFVIEDTQVLNFQRVETTIRDHVNDILLNPKNAGYFVANLPHNITQGEVNYYTANPTEDKRSRIFLYRYLDFSNITEFPQPQTRLNNNGPKAYTLFIGSENSVALLHNHESVFFSQIYGKKIARLVHPKYIKQCACEISDHDVENCISYSPSFICAHDYDSNKPLYCEDVYYTKHCLCPLEEDEYIKKYYTSACADIVNPDFEKYPELQNIEVQEAILEPGDILYIPDRWLHDLRALTTSISIASGF
ncbi:hypothetical protein AYO37_00245 [Opitutia bacterium SCGC AG-212-L18]|nr:hypothetical protein AYO37_00245 [Opitutae bacterium SCGC AG-212-L18]